MTQTTSTPTTQTTPARPTTPSKDRTMSHLPRPVTRALTYLAYFIGLLALTTLWTVYGPSYDAQALPTDATSTTSDPCPAGEATGGTCGSEGQVDGPDTLTSPSDPTSPATEEPARRCKGCRLTQEEYDARQADKQAAHDRAQARRQRGAERRAEAQRKREEKAARKAPKSSSKQSGASHATSPNGPASPAAESSSDGLPAQDGTSAQADAPDAAQDAPSASGTDSDDSPAASAPYTPLEIPEASRRPAPYDASKDPFEVRREAARQAADAVNHASDRVSPATPSPAPTAGPNGYWAEQLPTWALALIGFLAAAGAITYKVSKPRRP